MNRNFEKLNYYFRRYGFRKTSKKVLKKLFGVKEKRTTNLEDYKIWMQHNELTEEDIIAQSNYTFSYSPKISIVVPMYNTKASDLNELVESVVNQTYGNFELCLADGSDIENEEREKIIQIIKDNEKIKYKKLDKNEGISGNTNEAIKMAEGEFIGFMDHDDLISRDCLYEIVRTINENEDRPDFIYSDEDKIDVNGQRFEPYFKPDYSPEALECNNYITHFVVVSKRLMDKIGMLDSNYDGAQDFDFVLRATEKANRVMHISKILYHWRVSSDSTAEVADNKPYAYEAGKRAIEAHLNRMGKVGKVSYGNDVPGIYKIEYEVTGNPKVSIIIPNKDNIKYLSACIKSILKLTTYQNYEIVIIENNSVKSETFDYYDEIVKDPKIRVYNYNNKTLQDADWEDSLDNSDLIDFEKDETNGSELVDFVGINGPNEEELVEFNYSALINFAVKLVDSDYILQLNNDTKLISPDWLEIMIGYMQKNPQVGAIGGRLYYDDKTIQHAGIIVGLGGFAGNMLVNLPYGKHAYFGREAATRNVMAVTGACLFTTREMYEEVNYMDEDNLKVALNDVDFCLKIFERGYRIVYNPYVELWHYESKSRGYEFSKEHEERFNKEVEFFKNKWKKYLDKNDPYYNYNLSIDSCNYEIDTKMSKDNK